MKIEEHRNAFKDEVPAPQEISQRIKDNAPTGVLKKKWTGETLACPVCAQEALDKFEGGVNVEPGEISHTSAIYHCRVCNINLTQEELDKGE